MSLDDVSAYLKVQHRRRGISILPSDWMVPYSEQVSRIAASRERLRRNPKRPKLVVDQERLWIAWKHSIHRRSWSQTIMLVTGSRNC